MSKKRQKLLDRLAQMPDEVLGEVEQALDDIDAVGASEYRATAEELEGIDRGQRDADRGRFATDEEVEEAFASFRA
jgi:predicted transcriptional regulator